MTLTTRYPFTPYGVAKANEALTKMMRWLKQRNPNLKYTSGLDMGPRNGVVHFNVLCNGDIPKRRAVKNKWFSLTECHDVLIKPAHSNSAYYLVLRASQLPNTKDGELSQWSGVIKGFRRIRASVGLYPAPKKRAESGPWVAAYVTDDDDLSSSSMVADIAIPRKAGDTADRPSLTGEQHGHEGEADGPRVLVEGVPARSGRAGSPGDEGKLGARREASRRASAVA